jgi:thiamine-monophosphate kinase
MTEFELIRRYFATQPVRRPDVAIGIGDDAAVLDVPPGRQLVVTTDILVSGVHFLPEADPASLGHKSLAVNLSDLAAMGAEPAWFTLDLAMPIVDEAWLSRFCEGLYALARRHGIQLVGGDTSRGPLAIAITACGFVPRGQALTRRGARAGDRICVTGTLGDAGLALAHHAGRLTLPGPELAAAQERLDRPRPRLTEGLALRGIASTCIDVSDGLVADLGHILEESGVGARIMLDRVPVSATYAARVSTIGWDIALATGDDYELCFTVPPDRLALLEQMPGELRAHIAQIGEITTGDGLTILDAVGNPYRPGSRGHDHFRSSHKP